MAIESGPIKGVYTQAGDKLNTGVAGTFIPEIWTDQLLEDLEEALVLGSATITNRNYEGEFRREGDVIRIPHFVDTVDDKGRVGAYGSIGDADRAELEYIKMTVNKGSSFHLEIDALHQLQTKAGIDLMSELIRQRGKALARTMDRVIAQTIVAAVAGKDSNGVEAINVAPAELAKLPDLHGAIDTAALPQSVKDTKAVSVYDYVVDMLERLDVRSAPEDSRYLFIAPKLRSAILRDKKFIDASHFGHGVMPTGVIGTILGVPVRVTNSLGVTAGLPQPKLGAKQGHGVLSGIDMIMGSTQAVSLVIPHAEMDSYRPEKKFVDAIKSRVIYDTKVIRPEQIIVAKAVEADIAAINKPTP
ncbi:hypothetical protein [Embleya hyalina]|uniref:Uncharacterized protein n=1 Tax=Embleya hyalina TaxID=516124 RepID=A0A401YZ06_9ACTN|nr:hypothetical protein [Embleya hyalina]GCD99856.1 hypothetical protein EHYA_07578 [Embleya hyalina]